MKHAKGMVLLPEDVLHRFEQRQRLETPPLTANMMHKDTVMDDILQRTDLNDDQKQKLYNTNMERYLDLKRQKDGQATPLNREELGEKEPRTQLSDELIVEHIPKTMRPRATTLLNRLKTRPDIVSWDESGQVKLDGKLIPSSNISDLVSDAMRERKNFNPVGSSEFFNVLSKMNMPRDIVRNDGSS